MTAAKMGRVLAPEHSIPFCPQLGQLFGVCGALLLQQIHYFVAVSPHLHDGKKWVYNTHEEWAKQIGVFGPWTVRMTIKKLASEGILLVGNFNSTAYDRTAWYSIDYPALLKRVQQVYPNACLSPNPIGDGHAFLSLNFNGPIPYITEKNTDTSQASAAHDADIPEPPMPKQPASHAVILQQLKEAKKAAPVSMLSIWQSLVAKSYPELGVQPEMTIKAKAQFKKACAKIEESAPGHGADVLRHTIPRWIEYTSMVQSHTGYSKSPLYPQVGYLLMFSAQAAQFWREGKAPTIKKTAIVKSATLPPAAPEPDAAPSAINCKPKKEVATHADVMAWKPK